MARRLTCKGLLSPPKSTGGLLGCRFSVLTVSMSPLSYSTLTVSSSSSLFPLRTLAGQYIPLQVLCSARKWSQLSAVSSPGFSDCCRGQRRTYSLCAFCSQKGATTHALSCFLSHWFSASGASQVKMRHKVNAKQIRQQQKLPAE